MAAPPPASEDAALSLGLARTKARSYGSTGRARALGHGDHVRLVQHRVRAGDTLAGLALKYGVTVSGARGRAGAAGSGPGPPDSGR